MNFEQFIKVFPLVISLLQAVIWPLLALSILLYLRVPLKKFIGEVIEVSLKAGPIETVARRQQAVEVAVSLEAATSAKSSENVSSQVINDDDTQEIITLVDQLLTPETSKSLVGKRVLWVDDNPSNNTYERNALEALGLRFTIAISTEDALKQLQKRNVDVIISDMGRGLDKRAGYTLLEKVKALGNSAPYIIYAAGANRPENRSEALKRGASASVGGPARIFKAVIQALIPDIADKKQAI